MKCVKLLAIMSLVGLVGCTNDDSAPVVNLYDVNRGQTVNTPEEEPPEVEESTEPAAEPPAIEDPDGGYQPDAAPSVPYDLADNPAPTHDSVEADPSGGNVIPSVESPPADISPAPATEDLAGDPNPLNIADTAPTLDPTEIRLRPQSPADPTEQVDPTNAASELRGPANGDQSQDVPAESIDTEPNPSETETPAADPTATEQPATDREPVADVPADPNVVEATSEQPVENATEPEVVAPPAEAIQPKLPLDTTSELRQWVDSTGRMRIKARFIRFDKNLVILETESGDEKKVPMSRFSKEDQKFLKRIERGDFGI